MRIAVVVKDPRRHIFTPQYTNKLCALRFTLAHRVVPAVEADRFPVELEPVHLGGCQEQVRGIRHGGAPNINRIVTHLR
jgi:hypothetical protein